MPHPHFLDPTDAVIAREQSKVCGFDFVDMDGSWNSVAVMFNDDLRINLQCSGQLESDRKCIQNYW